MLRNFEKKIFLSVIVFLENQKSFNLKHKNASLGKVFVNLNLFKAHMHKHTLKRTNSVHILSLLF